MTDVRHAHRAILTSLLVATVQALPAADAAWTESVQILLPDDLREWVTHDYRADGLSVQLPVDWLPIPEFAIREFSEGRSSQLPGLTGNIQFKYAFQRGPTERWFQTPYMLIDIRQGRPSRRQLASIPVAQRRDEKGSPGMVESMPVGAVHLEKEKNIVWMNLRHRLPNDRSARCVSALLPTRSGVIQLNMYAQESEAPTYLKLFEQIALRVRLDPAIAYKKYPLESLPLLNRLDWTKPGMRYAEILLVALIIALFGISIIITQRRAIEKMRARD